jgi:hypothetical protein
VLRDGRVQRPLTELLDELTECFGGESASPEHAVDPVGHLPPPRLAKAANVANDRPVGEDRPDDVRVVLQEPGPMRVELGTATGRKRGEGGRDRIALMLEEGPQVLLCDGAEHDHPPAG